MNLKNKVIIFNGPPYSGKDSITEYICKKTKATHSEFKDHLYKCTSVLFNIALDDFKNLATTRETKEQITPLLTVPRFVIDRHLYDKWMSPREALIFTSENIIKPQFGKRYFGRIAANNLTLDVGNVFSDGGFNEELIPVLEKTGSENLLIVKLYRGNCSFSGDSRSYLNVPEGVDCLELHNNKTIEEAGDTVLEWILHRSQ